MKTSRKVFEDIVKNLEELKCEVENVEKIDRIIVLLNLVQMKLESLENIMLLMVDDDDDV